MQLTLLLNEVTTLCDATHAQHGIRIAAVHMGIIYMYYMELLGWHLHCVCRIDVTVMYTK